jgi:hypothetical protein
MGVDSVGLVHCDGSLLQERGNEILELSGQSYDLWRFDHGGLKRGNE